MGLTLFFSVTLPPMRHVADDSLAAVVDVDMLDRHLLLAAGAISLQGFHLGREGARQLVECALRAVLLGDVLDVGEPPGERHRREMYGGHLGGKHGLELILRLYAGDD